MKQSKFTMLLPWWIGIVVCFNGVLSSTLLSDNNIIQVIPPPVKFGVNYDAFDNSLEFRNAKDDDGFIWEKSGLFEGDIMTYTENKNGVINESLRWDQALVPFYIEEKHFSDSEVEIILSAIKEFHSQTCLRFKPYKPSDVNWVFITGNESGCWSSVGMKGKGGQQLNVNSPKCVKKGVLIHELLHAAGFYHQQSASNRDDYVNIFWENIAANHESNFNKYDDTEVTAYGTSYDYESIMHYSGKAFSKNGNDTIVALQKNITTLGQRNGFTQKDLLKLNRMYNSSCNSFESDDQYSFASIIDWFRTLFK